MGIIKNFDSLNKTPQRSICLNLIEAALDSIQPQNIVQKNFSLNTAENVLTIKDKTIDLKKFERIFLLGFGKGAAGLSKQIENVLGNLLTKGYVIDLAPIGFSRIEFSLGTHPLPSENNINFTKNVIEELSNLTERDLVIVVIAGGGSALFESPYKVDLEKLIEINKSLLLSGANITEMNIVRKHLSLVKGGGLIKPLFPASIVSVIASDVPGNDLSIIASGPTVKDPTTKEDALNILKKFNLLDSLRFSENDFLETPKEDRYFNNTTNVLLVDNDVALLAMKQKASELNLNAQIFSDRFQSDAKIAGRQLIEKTPPHQILLAGGETTVKVVNVSGKGGRNQDLVLAALPFITPEITIAAFDSDGWDNGPFAGAIADVKTLETVKTLGLDPNQFLTQDDSFSFFEKVGDGIETGRLSSNVSDLMIVLKR